MMGSSAMTDTEAVQASDDCSAGIVIMAIGMPMTMQYWSMARPTPLPTPDNHHHGQGACAIGHYRSLVLTFSEVLAPPVGSESALQKPVIPTAPAVSATPSYCKSSAPALCTTEQLFYDRTMAVPNST